VVLHVGKQGAHLVGAAVPVLVRAQHAERLAHVLFKAQHHIHHVHHGFGAGDLVALGHVALGGGWSKQSAGGSSTKPGGAAVLAIACNGLGRADTEIP